MTPPNSQFAQFEGFLTDTDHQTKADAMAELAAAGTDLDAFQRRVFGTVQKGYTAALKQLAATEKAAATTRPGWLEGLKGMTRDAMLAVFARLQAGEFGAEYQGLAIQRCRNRAAEELTNEELRSWLEDVGDTLGTEEQ